MPRASRLLVLIVGVFACHVAACPVGAKSCTAPDPNAHGPMNSGDGGYSVTWSNYTYTPGGETLTVVINSTTATFRGFNIFCQDQAQPPMRWGTFVGSTTDGTNARSQMNQNMCNGGAATWTHTSAHDTQAGIVSDTLLWTPPATGAGDLTCSTYIVGANYVIGQYQAWFMLPTITLSGPGAAGPPAGPPPPPLPLNVDGIAPAQQSQALGEMTIKFSVNDTALFVTLSVAGDRWMAIGFPYTGSDGQHMVPAEVYIMWWAYGQPRISTRFNGDYNGPYITPVAGPTAGMATPQVATIIAASQVGGVTSISFVRPLNPGGGLKALKNEPTPMIYAYSGAGDVPTGVGTEQTPGGAGINKHCNAPCRNPISINLFTGSASAVVDPLRVIHGLFMALSWIILINSGIIIARFYKTLGHKWFILHQVLAGSAVGLTVIGFIIAIVMVKGQHVYPGMSPTVSVHKLFGLVVVLGAILQPAIGKYADLKFDPSRKGTPCFPDKAHWWVGRITLMLGVINVFLGFASYGTGIALYIVVAIIVAGIIGFTIFKQTRGGTTHHGDDIFAATVAGGKD